MEPIQAFGWSCPRLPDRGGAGFDHGCLDELSTTFPRSLERFSPAHQKQLCYIADLCAILYRSSFGNSERVSRKNSLCITKETPFLRGPVKRSHGVTLLDRERPLVLYNVHVCDGFSDKILAARGQGLAS